ncbi:MAG: hypothetical protein LBM98_05330 [Oscillospiraceae bacterium]|jgi:hypothetical protein|nr:hypothetical protein [Oscillospiraceae bacterium]
MSSGPVKFLSVIIAFAVLLYFGIPLFGMLEEGPGTVVAENYTAKISAPLSGGIILRDEEYVEYPGGIYVDVTAVPGKHLSKGQAIAVLYSSEALWQGSVRVREIDENLRLLNEVSGGDKLAAKLKTLTTELRELPPSSDPVSAGTLAVQIDYLLKNGDNIAAIAAQLKTERAGIAYSSSGTVAAKQPGVFYDKPDGFVTYKGSPLNITTDELARLRSLNPAVGFDVAGAMVYGTTWYYAAETDNANAKALDGITPGDRGRVVPVLFDGTKNPVDLKIETVNYSEKGNAVIVFSCKTALADFLGLRFSDAKAITKEYSGLFVPRGAVKVENSKPCVYIVSGPFALRKYIDILTEEDNGYVVKIDPGDTSGLRMGDIMLIGGKDLYDGKIL